MPAGQAVQAGQAGQVVKEQTSRATKPPMEHSNEVKPDQLRMAREQGDAYGAALRAMGEEEGAAVAEAGNFIVALVTEEAEGMYGFQGDRLVWREAPEEANAHIEIAVADAGDGRFVPGLDVMVTVLDGDNELFTHQVPFVWHPFLYHYGLNAKVPGEGPFTVKVRIEAPTFMRHDPKNGKRYADPVDVVFHDVQLEPGRKLSPDAEPRGAATPFAG